jgi:hypothetical protein
MNKQNEIIPIGKYKGQPIGVLRSDPDYCDWLLAQDWMQSKYPQLRTIIINNFGEASETPEHNALQARFLDEAIINATTLMVYRREIKSSEVKFEWQNIDVFVRVDYWSMYASDLAIELKPTMGDDYPSVLRIVLANKQSAKFSDGSSRCADRAAVVIGNYAGTGATFDQVRAMFESSGVRLFLMREIEEIAATFTTTH